VLLGCASCKPDKHFDSGIAILFENLDKLLKNQEKLKGENNQHIVREFCFVAGAK